MINSSGSAASAGGWAWTAAELVLYVVVVLALLGLLVLGLYRVREWRRRLTQRKVQALSEAWEAGRGLAQREQWAEAVAALDKALSLVRHKPVLEPDVHFYRGYALEQMQLREQALMSYAACEASEAGRTVTKYRPLAAFRGGYLLAGMRRWSDAALKMRQSIQEAKRASLPGLQLSASRILLGVYQLNQRYAQASECLGEALHLARQLGDEPTEALILDMGGDVYVALGRTEDALQSYEQSLDQFRKLGHPQAEQVVKADIGKVYQVSGDWDKALRWFQAWLAEEEQAGNAVAQAQICYDIACLDVGSGRLDEAGAMLERSMGLFRRVHDKTGADRVGRTLMGLGILLQRRATAGQMTFRDIERGSAKQKRGREE